MNIKTERGNAEALKILNLADVTTAIRAPSTLVSMKQHIQNCMDTDSTEFEFNLEEASLMQKAFYRLNGKKIFDDMDYG